MSREERSDVWRCDWCGAETEDPDPWFAVSLCGSIVQGHPELSNPRWPGEHPNRWDVNREAHFDVWGCLQSWVLARS